MRRTIYRTKAWRLWLPIGVLAAIASPAAIAGLTTQDLNTATPDSARGRACGPRGHHIQCTAHRRSGFRGGIRGR